MNSDEPPRHPVSRAAILGLDLPEDVRGFHHLLTQMHPCDREGFCLTAIDTCLEQVGRAVDVARWRERDGAPEVLADLVALADSVSALRGQWTEFKRVRGFSPRRPEASLVPYRDECREAFDQGLGRLLYGLDVARWRDQGTPDGPAAALWGVAARMAIAWTWARES